jgi:hypothetical protein
MTTKNTKAGTKPGMKANLRLFDKHYDNIMAVRHSELALVQLHVKQAHVEWQGGRPKYSLLELEDSQRWIVRRFDDIYGDIRTFNELGSPASGDSSESAKEKADAARFYSEKINVAVLLHNTTKEIRELIRILHKTVRDGWFKGKSSNTLEELRRNSNRMKKMIEDLRRIKRS